MEIRRAYQSLLKSQGWGQLVEDLTQNLKMYEMQILAGPNETVPEMEIAQMRGARNTLMYVISTPESMVDHYTDLLEELPQTDEEI